ncbi:glycosyltransferase family 4 protein [Flavivirga spongiicola]|uniref:Glycosyltransferase family 4 protein n=1 Tax=Flavivirga spongiicola TaxID=421621 RepID=A0ABU7XVJ0_9FLAO|nr:glycosyltransferase family 4 protein [Flavivirga sp. MEBiC05379]MDO5979796.1 glycosyltransferase family 4 protein [Flavivirga sp. MEBiC05379]
MKKKRIFIVNQADDSQKYGVGKYIDEILEEAKVRNKYFDLVSVFIGESNSITVEKNEITNITYLKIPKPIFHKEKIQSLSYLYSKAVFIILHEFYKFNKNDVFHFNSNMQYFLMNCIKEHTNAKIIYTIHVSLWKTHYNNNFNKFISEFKDPKEDSFHKKNIQAEIKNCELSDQVICLSETMKKDVFEIYKIPKHKVHKIPNGIREQKFNTNDSYEIKQIRKELQITKKDFIFLYLGRLNAQKGVVQLIEVFKSVLQEGCENAKLLIVGGGEMKEDLIKACCGFDQKIIFIGYVQPFRVKLYYKLANALIFPSLNEQSSYVMLEAMSYKVPMIVTESDIFKMLKNEYSCLKIELNEKKGLDRDSFKEKIKIIIQNKELRDGIIKNAYNLYIEKYSSKMMFDKTYLQKVN